jgi:hypothetical protein
MKFPDSSTVLFILPDVGRNMEENKDFKGVVEESLDNEKAHIVKGKIKEELLARKREYVCSFCGDRGNSEVDDSDLVLCFRCLGILQLHREALKLFLR